jgi:CubicO group peptidase (beta-lactamase class C family)
MHAGLGFDLDRVARLPARIEADIAAGRYDGACLIVTRRGETVYRGVHGYAERAQNRQLAIDDVFATFSAGKQFTNVLVLSRIEQGLLHFDLNIGEVIPEFRTRGQREIKLWHLLTHTSGIQSAIPQVPLEVLTDITRLSAHVANERPESAPGERVNYSIIAGHAVLAELVRRVDTAKRSFARILEEDLFRPLGMLRTALGPRDDLLARLCPVTACYSEPGMFAPADVVAIGSILTRPGCEIPAGGYLSTIDDLNRFALMLRGGGALDGVRILSPRTLAWCAQNFTGERPNGLFDYARDYRGWPPWPAAIGMGFFVRGTAIQPGPMSNLSSARTICGWGAGSSCFWVDPALDVTFAFLSTGLMEETYHIERIQRLSDLVITALIE